MTGHRTCPSCNAQLPVHAGLRTWCERCNWNIGDEAPAADEGFFSRQYVRLGERHGKVMLEALKKVSPHDLRPRWTFYKCIAFSLAVGVHLLSLTLFVAGIFVIVTGYPEVVPMLLGAAACTFAWMMRPKPGKVPSQDIASQRDFPALHVLVNDVARKLGGRPIDTIVVNEHFNAAYGVIGWRRVPVLWIGLPLWMALRPQERLALLGHEVAHGVNGDGTRGFIVWSALSALDEWIGFLRWPLRHGATAIEILGGYLPWILSIPVAALQSLLVQLLWLDKQQAEYFADYLGSTIAGTDAAVSTMQRLGCQEHLNNVLLQSAYSTTQSGAYILGLFQKRLASLPDREWQRLARFSQRERARLDASHPPTAYRIDFLSAHRIAEPSKLIAAEGVMNAVDEELKATQESLGSRLIAQYARD
jgi:Zn-dependent protease with chaperone function